MFRNNKILFAIALLLLLAMTACSGGQATAAAQVAAAPQNTAANSTEVPQDPAGKAPDAGSQSLESKLTIGILKLKGTDREVTAEQASALLTLWQSMKSLSENQSSSQDEVSALYQKIEAALTAEQIQTITDMTLTQDDLQKLMEEYGVSMPTREANGTMPAPDGTMQAPGGGPGGDGRQGGPQGTPPADMTPGAGQGGGPGGRGNGMSNVFIDPLIEYLQGRAG
jgi:ribosomal protein L11